MSTRTRLSHTSRDSDNGERVRRRALVCLCVIGAIGCIDDPPAAPRAVERSPGSVIAPTIVTANATLELINPVASNPTDPGLFMDGYDVNTSGTVVGGEAFQHALRYPPADTLPNPGNLDFRYAFSINDGGEIMGSGIFSGPQRAFHLSPSGTLTLLTSLQDPVWGTAGRSDPGAISNAGEMVGRAFDGPTGRYDGVVWTSVTAAPVRLTSIYGALGTAFPEGMAPGLSGSQRLIAGHSVDMSGGPQFTKPTMWVGTTPLELPGLPGISNIGGRAHDAADDGTIVGFAQTPNAALPVVWKDGALSVNLGLACQALVGNPSGDATGVALLPSGRTLVAARCGGHVIAFTSNAAGSYDGEILPCPTLGACWPGKVSSGGYITGRVETPQGTRAARWHYTPPVVEEPTVLIYSASGNEGSAGQFGAASAGPNPQGLLAIWDFGDGSPPDTAITLLHTYLDNGSYTITATVGSVTVTTNVNIPSVPPLATLVAPTGSVVTGSAYQLAMIDPSDPSPIDLAAGFTYAFDCGSGLGAPSPMPSTSCVAPSPGQVTVRGRITDKDGASSDIFGVVTVVPNTNQAPTVTAGGPYTGAEGSLISLGASSTDPDADPLAYAWDFGDATTGSGEAPAHVWNDNGMYSVRVIVSDGQLADTAFTTVTVSNASPSGSLVAPTGSLAQDAPFLVGIGSPTDPSTVDQVSLTFRFNCGSGFGEWGTTPNVTCTARGEPGKYNVVAAVRDKDGASVSYSRQVTVVNDAPIVTPTSTGVITVARGTPVAVSATFTDRAGDSPWTARVLWGKGQGNSNVGMVTPGIPFGAVNVYPKAGTYTVTLEVRDVHNAPGSSFITVIVQ